MTVTRPNGPLQHLRGTAAAWTSNNPVLNAGERGVETDTGKEKVGDGATHWTSLTYTTDVSKLPGSVVSVSSGTGVDAAVVAPTGTSNNGKAQARAYYTVDDFRAVIDVDDTNGLQLAGNAAIANNKVLFLHRTLTTSGQVSWGTTGGSPFILNIKAIGSGGVISWTGSGSTTIFQTWGLVNSSWEGLNVQIPSGVNNLTVFGHDVGTTQYSSHNTFKHCFVSYNAYQRGIVAWGLGLTAAAQDMSHWQWDHCYVDDGSSSVTFAQTYTSGQTAGTSMQFSSTTPFQVGDVVLLGASTTSHRDFLTIATIPDSTHLTFTGATTVTHTTGDTVNISPVSGNVGWVLGGSNTLANSWTSTLANNLNKAITNSNVSLSGGVNNGLCGWTIDPVSFHGNWIDVEVSGASGFVGTVRISGGRIENTGHRVINANISSVTDQGLAAYLENVSLFDEATNDGNLFTLNGAIAFKCENCDLFGSVALISNLFQVSCKAGVSGVVSVTNSRLSVTSATFWTIGTGNWDPIMFGNLFVGTNGRTLGRIPDTLPWLKSGKVTALPTTVASGSNAGVLANIATWTSPAAGQLGVASTAGWPSAGFAAVVTSGGTANVQYTGTSGGNLLTGCTYIGTNGSAGDTVSTGGAVTPTTAIPQGAVNVETTSVGGGASGSAGGTAASSAAMVSGPGGGSGGSESAAAAIGTDTHLIHSIGAGGAAVGGHAAGSAGAGSIGLVGNTSSVTGWPSMTVYSSAPGGAPGPNGITGTVNGGVMGAAASTVFTGTGVPLPGCGGYTSTARGECGGSPIAKVGGGGSGGGPASTTLGGTGGLGGTQTAGGAGSTTAGGSATINGTAGTQGTDGTGAGGGGGGAGAWNGGTQGSGGNSGRGGNGRTEWRVV